MKYVILVHSNPQPWGHPTGDFVAEHQAQPAETRERLGQRFDELMDQMQANGELIDGTALADPALSKLYTWQDGDPVITDGPYSETKEHLAGFFLIDVESADRVQQIGEVFAGPGETIEIRPVMWGGADE